MDEFESEHWLGNLLNVEEISTNSILETLPDGVLLLNEGGKVAFVNFRFIELTGYKLTDLTGLSHVEMMSLLIPENDSEHFNRAFDHYMTSQGTEVSVRRKLHHREGYLIPVEICAYPVRDRYGKNRGTLLVCKDLGSELLFKIISTINSSLQLREVLNNTTRAVVDYLGLSSNAIFLLDKDKQLLRMTSCNLFCQEEWAKIVFPMGIGPPGIIARDRKPLYVANLREAPLLDEFVRNRHEAKSSIGYPLICQGDLLGVIAFDAVNVREFSLKERDLFESIAGQVALAIYNAQLFAKLEHLSITDGLTSLYNHRYFQERLIEELDRAKRNLSHLSLVMLDVDNFKKYNDCYGHPRGDMLLRTLARVIESSVRNFDVVCRYGGEEFAVILPNCDREGAKAIAERIRGACESYHFPGREKQPGGKITLSIGVASYPGAKDNGQLLHFADKALYSAKHYKNRVECYG